MAYLADTLGKGGVKVQNRMTFTQVADDRVRQFWEQSTDGGKTWTVVFDGDYRRRQ
jgi:hypothetical protein